MYKIKLPVFEGPFDLLLYLIRKNELDIYDIPIADITRQYLEYIEIMKMLDLEVAGEFIEMVATLMLIKARMLLPNPPDEGEEEIVDPRLELVKQLLEYKRFKEAAANMREYEHKRRKYFSRNTEYLRKLSEGTALEDEILIEASLFDLLTAFKQALDSMPKVTVHHVSTLKITLEDQVAFILGHLKDKPYVLFEELLKHIKEKLRLIITFMALLDLMKFGMVSAKQTEVFGEIRIVRLQEMSMTRYYALRDDVKPA